MIQSIFVQLSLIISPGPANCDNNFWNKIFTTYVFYSIRNDELYLVSENIFLWEKVWIERVIKYDLWPIKVKSNLF